MKRALITGSAGFVGRNFQRHLENQGWDAWGVDLVNLDPVAALDIFRDTTDIYDLVVHCAYHVGGREAIDGLNLNFARNLELDATMFQWALRTNQKHVVYFSSSAAYPIEYQTSNWIKYWGTEKGCLTEEDINFKHILPPDAYYGLAKLTGEHMACLARNHGLKVTVVRPFSGYGIGQSKDYPFIAILNRVLQGKYHVWGSKYQARDWIHISDVVRGAMAVVESGYDHPVNLCTGRPTTMESLVRMMYRALHPGEDSAIDVTEDQSAPMGVFHRVGNPGVMERFYTPRITLEDGIAMAVGEL